jgi:hypothetical protein
LNLSSPAIKEVGAGAGQRWGQQISVHGQICHRQP